MKAKTRVLMFSIFCFAVAFAYFFWSFEPLDTELQLTPEWTIDISITPEQPLEGEKILPFRLGQNIGYFTPSGKITLNTLVPYKAAISRNFFALYSADAENIKVLSPSGEEHCAIAGAGFPFFQQDRIFLLLPGGSSFAIVDNADGTLKSVYEHTSPITAFNSSQSGLSVGFADGDFLIFNNDGSLKISLAPGGSDYPVILGGSISSGGDMYACVSGQNPQRFVLYKNEGTYEKIIYHEFLKNALLRQTYVHFSDDDNFVYFNSAENLAVVDIKKLESRNIPLKGMVLDIQESPIAGSIFVLSRDKNEYAVTILENFKEKAGEFKFNAESAFILVENDSLFIGCDNKISRIKISKE